MNKKTLETLVACALAVFAVRADEAVAPPYEMVESGRTADAGPALLPLTDACGLTVEADGAEGRVDGATDRVLFGGGVLRLAYRATASNGVVRIRTTEPRPVAPGVDTVTLWIWGHVAPGYVRTKPDDVPVDISADFLDARGEPFSVPMGNTRFANWYMLHKRLDPDKIARVRDGGSFVGFTVSGFRNFGESYSIDLTSLRVFHESFGPVAVKPRPKRGYMNFPDADAGFNTGTGKLPFPNSELTVTPPVSKRPQVEFRLPGRAANWDDFAFRFKGGEWQNFAVGGGVYFRGRAFDGEAVASQPDINICGVPQTCNRPARPMVRPKVEKGSFRKTADGAVFTGAFYDGETFLGDGEIRFKVAGQSVLVDIWVRGGNVEEVHFGRWRAPGRVDYIKVPYYTYRRGRPQDCPNVLMADLNGSSVFFAAAMDWTQSAASVPYCFLKRDDGTVAANGATTYGIRTDGTRGECRERFVWSVSDVFEEVLPSIPNPPSPHRAIAGSHVWRAFGAVNRKTDPVGFRRQVRRGMRHLCVTDHEAMWRDAQESFTFRTNAAPAKGGDIAQYAYTRIMRDELGIVYGPYNTFLDISTVSEFWHPDRVMRTSGNQLLRGWQRCYVPKAAYACEMNDILTPVVQRKFDFNCAYCDQHTLFTPWTRIDYDARVPGAGTFAATYYAYGELLLNQRKYYGGPVFSEGGAHFIYAGLLDGNYAQEYTPEYRFPGSPWLVDFDLRRIHPLECDVGMPGLDSFYGTLKPSDRDYALDYWLAATLAFGHVGLLPNHTFTPDDARIYFMTQAIAAKYCTASVRRISYVDADGRLLDTSAALRAGAVARSQLVVEYDDGTVVAANGSFGTAAADMAVEFGGRRMTLPSGGFYARSGDGKAVVWCGLLNGVRTRRAKSEEYEYFADPAHEVWRMKEPGGSEELFLGPRTAEAELPYAAATAVGLDEDRKEKGPVPFTVENGRTRIGRFPAGVVSARIRRTE